MSEVKPPRQRTHEDYTQTDRWTVVDVDGVDRLFGCRTKENEVRLDIDGLNEPSSDVGDYGDRIQVSVWLPRDQLLEVAEKVQNETPPGDRA